MQNFPRLSTALLVPTSLVVAMFLTACGDKPAATDSSTAKNSSKKLDESVLAETQEITINNGTEPESLDPHKVSGVPEANLIRQMLVGLASTTPDGKTMPGMAESWESTDNKVWTFKLRDAKWSNGDPVTAEDFVYSFRRVLDPKTASPYASYLADAKVVGAQKIIDGEAAPDTLGVKAIDDKTFQVTLSEPVPYFPDMLIHTSTFPVHAATVEKFGDKWTDPANIVVNGAYKVTDWTVNDKIVLTRNESYFDNAKTTINKVTMLPIPEATTATQRYKAGELDVTTEIPTELFESLKTELGDEVNVSPKLCTYYYEFNTVKPPFNDARVRRALALALDRDVIVDSVLKQGQKSAYQFTPTSTQAMVNNTPEWESWDKEKRIAEAKKLLAEAGYTDAKPLKFELLYNTSESHKKIAVAVSSLFKQALGNVEVELNNKEWKTYLDTRRNGNYQLARAGWCGDYNEPSTFLNILKSGNSNNYGKYSSKTFDDLMSQTLRAGVTPEQRGNLYKQTEAQLDQDMPLLNVYHYVGTQLIKPYVVGFPVNDPLDNFQVKDMKIIAH